MTSAVATKTSVSLARSKGFRSPMNRRTIAAPASDWISDPVSMPMPVTSIAAAPAGSRRSSVAQLFSRNAPSHTPGQTRTPRRRIAASAMPEGGHTTVAIPGGGAASLPNFPVT